MPIPDERERVAQQGTLAWKRLKREKNWHDWLKVGDAMLVGREWAMRQAETNQPQGRGYNTAFGEWLTRYKMDDMDKGTRSRLFEVIDNMTLIEEWRRTLTLTERLALNHPTAILRRWKAAVRPEPPAPARPTLRDSVAVLSEDNAAQARRIADLEAENAELRTRPQLAPSNLHDAVAAAIDAVSDLSVKVADTPHVQLVRDAFAKLSALRDAVEVRPGDAPAAIVGAGSSPTSASPRAAARPRRRAR